MAIWLYIRGMYNEENSKRRQEMGKGREWHK